jgi:hypothetical protein
MYEALPHDKHFVLLSMCAVPNMAVFCSSFMCFPGMRLQGRRHRWKESIKVDKNVGFGVVDWIHVGQDRSHLRGIYALVQCL